MNKTKRKWTAFELTAVSMFAALMAIGANITSFAPFLVVGGVPITLQTFFSVLAGAILGSRLGAAAMIVYAFVGLAGIPVFAQFTGGIATIIKPTFGFILSFILVAYVTGKIVEKKQTKPFFIIATLVGMVINYVLGTNWMYFAFKFWAAAPEGFSYAMAWGWMMVPLPKDIILSVLAGAIAPRIYNAINKNSNGNTLNMKRVG